ncbi:MAG: hypothetical protein V3W11_12420 [bacterium]
MAFRLPEKWLPLFGLAGAVVIFLALTAAYFDYTIDDTYISLRYARSVAAGRGFVFDQAVPPVGP